MKFKENAKYIFGILHYRSDRTYEAVIKNMKFKENAKYIFGILHYRSDKTCEAVIKI